MQSKNKEDNMWVVYVAGVANCRRGIGGSRVGVEVEKKDLAVCPLLQLEDSRLVPTLRSVEASVQAILTQAVVSILVKSSYVMAGNKSTRLNLASNPSIGRPYTRCEPRRPLSEISAPLKQASTLKPLHRIMLPSQQDTLSMRELIHRLRNGMVGLPKIGHSIEIHRCSWAHICTKCDQRNNNENKGKKQISNKGLSILIHLGIAQGLLDGVDPPNLVVSL
ncbi:conserved hypothetical protein [Ricinus communis]|uniref:Uncharacterized protein n=1 Tax=Ricinus communis TaxID=3988 RepID=B9ST38_RICCO|nr:conserved hypothetical protein [Ricinus communis]